MLTMFCFLRLGDPSCVGQCAWQHVRVEVAVDGRGSVLRLRCWSVVREKVQSGESAFFLHCAAPAAAAWRPRPYSAVHPTTDTVILCTHSSKPQHLPSTVARLSSLSFLSLSLSNMDIMDSTDTPTGGLDQTTASSAPSVSTSSALPLSVDERDDFASPTNRTTLGGQEPTSSGSLSFSSGGSAFDRLDAAVKMDDDAPNSMPTSTDDVMMPRIDYESHPSLTGGTSSESVSTSSTSSTPLSQQAKDTAGDARDKAADMTDSARAKAAELKESAKSTAADLSDSAKAKAADVRDKAADLKDSAKAKAADARDRAADMADSAKAKAADMKDSAKATAADMQDKMSDTADSIKEKLEEGAEKVKEGGHRLLEMAKSGLHSAESSVKSAEEGVENKYEQHVKEGMTSGREAHKPIAPTIKSTQPPEPTDTHPLASSMRDPHLHPGLSSLPTHDNENTPVKDPVHTDVHYSAMKAGEEAHARAVADKDQAERDDPLQKGGILHRMHDKLEDGAEMIKERVDGFMERNVRIDHDEHLSAAEGRDLPTLVDSSNKHNTNQVRAKMHPSQERTMNGVDQE